MNTSRTTHRSGQALSLLAINYDPLSWGMCIEHH